MTEERLEKLKNDVEQLIMRKGETCQRIIIAEGDFKELVREVEHQRRVPSEEVQRAIKTIQDQINEMNCWYSAYNGHPKMNEDDQEKMSAWKLSIQALRQKEESERILDLAAKLNVIDLVRENGRIFHELRHREIDRTILQEKYDALLQMQPKESCEDCRLHPEWNCKTCDKSLSEALKEDKPCQ